MIIKFILVSQLVERTFCFSL